MKSLNFFQNSLGLFAIAMLALVSTLSIIALSPLAADNNTSQVAGLNTDSDPQILSNREALKVTDIAPQSVTYKTQLVQNNPNSYQLTITASKQKQGMSQRPFLRVDNPNSAPVTVKFSPQVAQFIADSVHVAVVTPAETKRVHDANRPSAPKSAEFSVPAKGSLEFELSYEFIRAVAFESEIVIRMEVN